MRYTDKKFWDSYYQEYQMKNVGRVYFADIFEHHLTPDQSKSVFEVGCAGGYTLCYLSKYFHYRAFGIDYSDELQKTIELFAFNKLPAPTLYQHDFFQWVPPQLYDVVCSFGFIEHFSDPRSVIKKHIDLVAPGGTLIITMPHFAHIQYILHWILDRKNLKKHNTKIMKIKAMKKALAGLPIEIIYLNFFRTFGFWTERKDFKRWERVLYEIIQFSHRVINKLLGANHPNSLISPHLVLVARKQ